MDTNQIKKALETKTRAEQDEAIKKISGISYQESLLALHDRLSPEQQAQLEEVLAPFKAGSKESDNAMAKFFKENIPNVSEIINETDLAVQERLASTLGDEEGINFESLAKFGSLAFQKIQRECLLLLEEEDKKELTSLLKNEKKTEADLISFFQAKIPTYAEIEKKATEKTANDISSIIEEARRRAAL